MMSSTEFTRRFAEAFHQLDTEDREMRFMLTSGHTGKPRASSLGSCGRKQDYQMNSVEPTDIGDPPWAASMGYAGEALAREALRLMGYTMETAVVPEDLVFSGHIDDLISGLDLDDEVLVWDNKVRGTYGMRMLMTKGLPAADVEMYLQMQAYMWGLGKKRCMITVEPHDLSLMKREVKSYMKGADVSPLIHRIVIDADPAAQRVAIARATEAQAAANLGIRIRREYNNASDKFPCGWCEWRSRCIRDDNIKEQLELTPIPSQWTALDLE